MIHELDQLLNLIVLLPRPERKYRQIIPPFFGRFEKQTLARQVLLVSLAVEPTRICTKIISEMVALFSWKRFGSERSIAESLQVNFGANREM